MSRGRTTNRLYLVEIATRVRDEIAPVSRAPAEAELVGQVRQSRRQAMALDVGGRDPLSANGRSELDDRRRWWQRRRQVAPDRTLER